MQCPRQRSEAPHQVTIAVTDTLSAGDAPHFVTADIPRFRGVYDAGGCTGDAAAFQRRYLDFASAGLRDFIGLRVIARRRWSGW